MITSSNRTDLFYGSQRITSRYLGDKFIWGEDFDAKSISFSNNLYFFHQHTPRENYNYTTTQIHLSSSEAKLIQGKYIISVEIDGKTSDVKWSFPTSGSTLNPNYLAVESTADTFTQVQNKVKSDYGKRTSAFVRIVVHYKD